MPDPVTYAAVDPETGRATCLGCGLEIDFLPLDHMPDNGPASLNHTGCPGAGPSSSPAGAHLSVDGRLLYETINPIERQAVEAFYARRRERGHTVLSESEAKGTKPPVSPPSPQPVTGAAPQPARKPTARRRGTSR